MNWRGGGKKKNFVRGARWGNGGDGASGRFCVGEPSGVRWGTTALDWREFLPGCSLSRDRRRSRWTEAERETECASIFTPLPPTKTVGEWESRIAAMRGASVHMSRLLNQRRSGSEFTYEVCIDGLILDSHVCIFNLSRKERLLKASTHTHTSLNPGEWKQRKVCCFFCWPTAKKDQ